MTLKEIKDLKEQYNEELLDLLKQFFKERPLIKKMFLWQRGCGIFSGSGILLKLKNVCDLDITTTLEGEEE